MGINNNYPENFVPEHGLSEQNLQLSESEIIEVYEVYKYLGITFDDTGTDERDIRNRNIQARRTIGCLNGLGTVEYTDNNTQKTQYPQCDNKG